MNVAKPLSPKRRLLPESLVCRWAAQENVDRMEKETATEVYRLWQVMQVQADLTGILFAQVVKVSAEASGKPVDEAAAIVPPAFDDLQQLISRGLAAASARLHSAEENLRSQKQKEN